MINPRVTMGDGSMRRKQPFFNHKTLLLRSHDEFIPVVSLQPYIRDFIFTSKQNINSYLERLGLKDHYKEISTRNPYLLYKILKQAHIEHVTRDCWKESVYDQIGFWDFSHELITFFINYEQYSGFREFPQPGNTFSANYTSAINLFNTLNRVMIEIIGFEGRLYTGQGFLGYQYPKPDWSLHLTHQNTNIYPLIAAYIQPKHFEYLNYCLLLGKKPDSRIFRIYIQSDFDSDKCPEMLKGLRTAYRKHLKDEFKGVEVIPVENMVEHVFSTFKIIEGKMTFKQIQEKVKMLGDETMTNIKAELDLRRNGFQFEIQN